MAYRFVARVGNRELRVALGDGDHLIGSAAECAISIDDPTISRRHATLSVQGRALKLTDLGSRNGTRLSGLQLAAQATVSLLPNQALRLGHIDGRVEEIADLDGTAAIQATEAVKPRQAGKASDPTLASAEYGAFCLDNLPALLDRIVDGDNHTSVAAAVCQALTSVIDGGWVEVARIADGRQVQLACSGNAATEGKHWSSVWGSYRLGAITSHSTDHQLLNALVPILLRVVHLAGQESLPITPQIAAAVPKPPDPPTQDPGLISLYEQAAVVGASDIGVLIEGESGSGKELMAQFIHASAGAQRPWVAVNCASLPRDLLEAELLGIEKGVATGVDARAGKFELAHDGTLFLDEIADMALESQAKILRVLQDRQVLRLGARQARKAHVRVVAATNRSLRVEVEQGRFRLDLYHRIADWVVQLPPLRERRVDVANLAAYFLDRACRKNGRNFGGISKAALAALEQYPWPGNIRELEREMARVALFLSDAELLPSDLLKPAIAQASTAPDESESLADQLRQREAELICAALRQHAQDVAAAAQTLGIGRSTLYRRMAELSIGGEAGRD